MNDMNDSSPRSKQSFMQGLITGVVIMVLVIGVFQLGRNSGSGNGLAFLGGSNKNTNAAPTNINQPTQPTQPAGQLDPVADTDHIRGDKNAPITFIEYSDFQCPYCAQFHPTVQQVLADYKGKVRFIYRHFPLRQIHPLAQKAAEASECAAEQNKFWEMHDKLFELNQAQQLTAESFKTAAGTLGLNASKFNDCLDTGKTASLVEAGYQSGIKAGVQGTPASFINGQQVDGAVPAANLKSIIDAASS